MAGPNGGGAAVDAWVLNDGADGALDEVPGATLMGDATGSAGDGAG